MPPGYKVYINSQCVQKSNRTTSPVNFVQKNQQIDRRKIKNMKRQNSPQSQSKMLKTLLDSNGLGIAVAVYANKDGSSVKREKLEDRIGDTEVLDQNELIEKVKKKAVIYHFQSLHILTILILSSLSLHHHQFWNLVNNPTNQAQ